MNNIDKYDDEINNKRIRVGIMFNMRQMNNTIDDIVDYTGEYDNNYPKSELIKILISILIIFQVLFISSINVFMIVTLPLLFFNLFTMIQLFKAFKRFNYKRLKMILITFLVIVIELTIAYFVRTYIFN